MWNVNERLSARLLEALPSAGFIVSSTGGVTRVEKYGCGAEFRRTSDDHYLMTILPVACGRKQLERLRRSRSSRNSRRVADPGRKCRMALPDFGQRGASILDRQSTR